MRKQADNQERERIARLAASCVCNNLRRAARAATNYYDSILGQASDSDDPKLRVSQVTMLVVLYLAGPQTINALAEQLALDRTTLTRNLKPLAQACLLTIAAGRDQRTRVVTLTPQGEEALLRALPLWEQAQAHMVAGMGHEQVAALLAQLSAAAALAHSA
jgi:DNA-binding MarR family transcriptional regulator